MELLHPAERALLGRLAGLAPDKKKSLLGEVSRISRRKRFFYKDENDHPVSLVPFVLGRRHRPTLEALTRALFRFQLRAPAIYRENYRGFADLVRLERRTGAWFARTGSRASHSWENLLRPDYTFVPTGEGLKPVLFELNSLMLGGIYIQSVAVELAQRTILPRLGARGLGITAGEPLLRFLMRWLLEARRKARAEEGGIAFLEGLPPGGGFSELPDITAYFKKAGIPARHGDPRQLEEIKGRICLDGMPVGYVYRDFSFEDVGGPDNPRLKRFMRLWNEGRVTPSFPADFDQKGIVECLTSEEFLPLFTKSEALLLRKHVPWTRVLTGRKTTSTSGRRVDLPEHVRENRETLVIKPSWSSGGDGILIGKNVKAARWEREIEKAVAKPGAFAVQAYVDTPPRASAYTREGEIRFKDCHYTLGMFHDGARFGCHFRISPKDIVNVAQGGALAPVYYG